MSDTPAVLRWNDLFIGRTATFSFCISASDMEAFVALSGDNSRIHRDDEFAWRHGFAGRIVYGGIMLARLSKMLGSHLPGDHAMSVAWQINYHHPLYVGEEATIAATVSHLSAATRIVKIKYQILVGDRLVASGSAESRLLED